MNLPRGLTWPHSHYAQLILVVGIGAVAYASVAMFYGRDPSIYVLLDALFGVGLVFVALWWGTEPEPAPVPDETPAPVRPEVVPPRKPGTPAMDFPAPRPVWAEDWSTAAAAAPSPAARRPATSSETVFSEIDRLSVELNRRRRTP